MLNHRRNAKAKIWERKNKIIKKILRENQEWWDDSIWDESEIEEEREETGNQSRHEIDGI